MNPTTGISVEQTRMTTKKTAKTRRATRTETKRATAKVGTATNLMKMKLTPRLGSIWQTRSLLSPESSPIEMTTAEKEMVKREETMTTTTTTMKLTTTKLTKKR